MVRKLEVGKRLYTSVESFVLRRRKTDFVALALALATVPGTVDLRRKITEQKLYCKKKKDEIFSERPNLVLYQILSPLNTVF